MKRLWFARRPGITGVLHWNRFELVVLALPLIRGVLFPFGVVPPQFEESQVAPLVRATAIVLLSIGAGVGCFGVIRQWPIIERAGMHLLAPLCIAYAVVLLAADSRASIVSVVIYVLIAAACADRAREITKSMRTANRWLEDAR